MSRICNYASPGSVTLIGENIFLTFSMTVKQFSKFNFCWAVAYTRGRGNVLNKCKNFSLVNCCEKRVESVFVPKKKKLMESGSASKGKLDPDPHQGPNQQHWTGQ